MGVVCLTGLLHPLKSFVSFVILNILILISIALIVTNVNIAIELSSGTSKMKINVNQYDEDQTLHITEARSGKLTDVESSQWIDEFYQICRQIYETVHKFKNSLETCKTIFGKQQTVKQYTHRNWIWTFTDEDNYATIYCLVSVRGIAWEYDKRSRKDHVMPLFRQVAEALTNYEQNNSATL